MIVDYRVIEAQQVPQLGDVEVLGQQEPVPFRDGTEVTLHPVQVNGVPETFLRALQHEGLHWHLLDLRQFSPSIERDMLNAHWMDTPGIVLYTLRLGYASREAFLQRVSERQLATWWRNPQQLALGL